MVCLRCGMLIILPSGSWCLVQLSTDTGSLLITWGLVPRSICHGQKGKDRGNVNTVKSPQLVRHTSTQSVSSRRATEELVLWQKTSRQMCVTGHIVNIFSVRVRQVFLIKTGFYFLYALQGALTLVMTSKPGSSCWLISRPGMTSPSRSATSSGGRWCCSSDPRRASNM